MEAAGVVDTGTNLLAIPLTGGIIPAILTTLILNGLGIYPAFVVRITELMISGLIELLDIIAAM